ncbi:IS1096 element passenger TnpR family protein [Bradyrhizobium diazoefficiens]|uniref:IS1096 element passenger TnpR family protein n=1 Tax=Bradyrhizobium diazoefficiens TaxID=1355477 RepID=UPI0028A20E50|nr:hypothetical protein [Bradyrhizobium diazoefficiens]
MIKLEKWFDNTTTEGLPLLLEAAGRCPPEDVGGAPGYVEYLDAIGEPAHTEHEQMRLWGPERHVIERKGLGRRQRFVRQMEAAASRHAVKIGVKRQSKGPQRYACA